MIDYYLYNHTFDNNKFEVELPEGFTECNIHIRGIRIRPTGINKALIMLGTPDGYATARATNSAVADIATNNEENSVYAADTPEEQKARYDAQTERVIDVWLSFTKNDSESLTGYTLPSIYKTIRYSSSEARWGSSTKENQEFTQTQRITYPDGTYDDISVQEIINQRNRTTKAEQDSFISAPAQAGTGAASIVDYNPGTSSHYCKR